MMGIQSALLDQVVETYPYEMLSHAVLAWVVENIAKCDVIHAHEWGGVFSALATVANYRQLKPGKQQPNAIKLVHTCSMSNA